MNFLSGPWIGNNFDCAQKLIWLGKLSGLTWVKKLEQWGEFWLRNHIYQTKLLQFILFWTKIFSLGLKPLLLTPFKMYQMYLSSQSSILAVTLNQAIHQRALNPYQQSISEKGKTTLPFVIIKAFSFVISFSSLCSILLSFTLYRI